MTVWVYWIVIWGLFSCSERAKFAQLRETFTQLQKSHQHLEKEVTKRKERETEMLALTEKLSSSNAELQVERSEWETKVDILKLMQDHCFRARSFWLGCRFLNQKPSWSKYQQLFQRASRRDSRWKQSLHSCKSPLNLK